MFDKLDIDVVSSTISEPVYTQTFAQTHNYPQQPLTAASHSWQVSETAVDLVPQLSNQVADLHFQQSIQNLLSVCFF
jgi:hypothetical protein